MYSKCDDWLIELCLVTSCLRDHSWEWLIPTWICPAPLFPSPCWIWVQSPAALFASPRFSPTASGAPSASVSGRARTFYNTTHLQHVELREEWEKRRESVSTFPHSVTWMWEVDKLLWKKDGGSMTLKTTYIHFHILYPHVFSTFALVT